MISDCIDLANYTTIPTVAQVDDLKDSGVRRAIVGTSFGLVWLRQIKALEEGGIEVQEYQFPGRLRATHRKVWLDCETPEATVDQIRRDAPKVHGIYTRRGWWTDETGDWKIAKEFPHLRLWEAHYGYPPPVFLSFGGWMVRDIIQWHDSINFCGLNVDLNVIEEVVAAPAPPEEQDMKSFLVWCAEEHKVYFVGPAGAKWIPGQGGTAGPVYAELEKEFGPMAVTLSSAALRAIG